MRNRDHLPDLARRRHPTTCESANHHHDDCWGWVRVCPCCGKRVCYEDGVADDVDDAIPGICDTCFCEVEQGNELAA